MPKSRNKRSAKGANPSPRGGQTRSSPWRLAAFLSIVVVVLVAAAFLLKPVVFPESAQVANALPLEISMDGFSRKLIQGKVGEPVNIMMNNPDTAFHTDGGGQHNFVVDELEIKYLIPPRNRMLLTFTPDRPGTFEFYCDICCGGRENPTMVGKLVVT